jgi:hypothetical protein
MNIFWRNTKLEKHHPDDDPLDVKHKEERERERQEKERKDKEERERREKTPKGKVTCEFCECVISTESGEYASLSSKAKSYRELEDTNKKLASENAALTAKVKELEAKPSPTEVRKWGFTKKT